MSDGRATAFVAVMVAFTHGETPAAAGAGGGNQLAGVAARAGLRHALEACDGERTLHADRLGL